MHRRWFVSRTNQEYITYLSKAASISAVTAQVLINRGIRTVSEVRDFIDPGNTGLSDPFELPGMLQAIGRVRQALHDRETVLVHGDYDADGLTATAIMVSALRKTGLNVHYFIPHRITHGYGFNLPGVKAAEKAGARLIVTVDCGIGSFDAVEQAGRLGIDVIITDHHEPARKESSKLDVQNPEEVERDPRPADGFMVPEAAAIINPKLAPHASPLSVLCGAGIAYKLSQALALHPDIPFSEDDLLPLLDLAAIGTIADVVPLTGENRIIIREAMPMLRNGTRAGIRALKQASGINDRQLKAGLLSYTLVPRINAAGRIGDANDVIRLFLSESQEETSDLAEWLNSSNSERQRIEEAVFLEALSLLRDRSPDSVVMLAGRGWHHGVLGIVASKIAEAFNLPAFIFSLEDGIAKGSCRSIPAFDICRGLSECSELLMAFGGHKQAAGVALRADQLPALEDRMRQIIQRDISREDLSPILEIHAPVRLSDVTAGLMKELDLLEPFGCGNPEPLLGARELNVSAPKVVGSKHLRMKLKKGSSSLDAIGFDMAGLLDDIQESLLFDAAFTPAWNEWNGSRNLQLILKGLRPSA